MEAEHSRGDADPVRGSSRTPCILNSPTTHRRDRAVVEYLERVLELDAWGVRARMFEETSDVSDVSADVLVKRTPRATNPVTARRS